MSQQATGSARSPHATELLEQGYTILPDILDQGRMETARMALDRIFAEEEEKHPELKTNPAPFQVAHMLPARDPFFLALAFQQGHLLSIFHQILGDGFIMSAFNGLAMRPQGGAQQLHMDQPESIPGMIITINATLVLDDFTAENGATRVVPGSHLKTWPRWGKIEGMEDQAIQLEAPAGSAIAFCGGILHAGSANRTNKPRRALHLFSRPWVLPHWDFQRSLPPGTENNLAYNEKYLLGFSARPEWFDLQECCKRR